MATGDVSLSIPEEYVEEKLINGVLYGSLEHYEGLMETLKDIDVRDRKRRTLLHLGVSLGKRDWVEGLLAEGADPSLRDGGGVTAVEMAEEMREMYPGDEDRTEILRLVQLVHKRDIARKRRHAAHVGDIAEASVPHFFRETAVLSALKESIDSLKAEMSSFGRRIAEEVNKLRRDLSDRDALIRCLEGAVTSSVEELRALKKCLGDRMNAVNDRRSHLSPVDKRRECVDSLIGRTIILNTNESKVASVRIKLEKLYDMSPMTSCVLMFLKDEPLVRVMVDCDSFNIGNMKSMVRDHDGVIGRGIWFRSFADLEWMTVYLGGKVDDSILDEYVIGCFAMALAQMANCIAFENRGKPYELDDGLHERQFKSALQEADRKLRKLGVRLGLDFYIKWALNKNTQLGKEIYFASIVPRIIAEHGSPEGISILLNSFPSLMSYYMGHVMVTLRNKARL